MDGYLAKPIRIGMLATVLQEVCDRKRCRPTDC